MTPDDGEPAALARAMLGNAVGVKRGENVVIETWNHTLPYATACVVEARRLGAHPMLLLEDETAYWRSMDVAPAIGSWSKVGDHEWAALAKTQAYVFFSGPADRPRFMDLPDTHKAQLVSYGSEWSRRARAARVRGVRSMLGEASEQQATAWGVSGPTWRSQLIQSVVEADMAAIRRDAERTEAKLRRGKTLRITASNGTDLTLKLKGRAPYVDDGVVGPDDLKVGHNITISPPGYVAVAVEEHSAEGMAIASRPSYLRSGKVEGGQWELHEGHLVNFWYTDGQATFEAAYGKVGKGRDVLSLFGIGLNGALAPGVPQAEDQEAGAVTLGIGGNLQYGGANRTPFFSWIVIGEATVAVDGKPLADRGKIF
ncbi:MAG: aminopeptidase [Thermoplasmata archaeon]|nr:aminopeptidase [Thermoplasmata archaeon]